MGKEYTHVVVREEAGWFDLDRTLVAVQGRFKVAFTLLDDAQIVVDLDFLREHLVELCKLLDRLLPFVELLQRYSVVCASFLVDLGLFKVGVTSAFFQGKLVTVTSR